MNRLLFFFGLIALLSSGCQSYQIKLIGEANSADGARRMIQSADGNFLVAGYLHNKACLYRLDCEGEIIQQAVIEIGQHSVFNALVELPDQKIVAAGSITDEGKAKGLLVLFSPSLEVLKTSFADIGSSTNIKDLAIQSPEMLFFVGETLDPMGLSTIYLGKAKATTLDGAASPVFLNYYGKDSVFLYRLTSASNGDLLLCGGSCKNNLSTAEPIAHQAWVSRINLEGKLLWIFSQKQSYSSSYGASYFSSVSVNPSTGNLLATGVRFSGDASEYQTDPYAVLLSPDGELITEAGLPLSGQQNLFDCKTHLAGGLYFAVGDSSGLDAYAQLPRPVIIEIEEDSLGSLKMSHRSVDTELSGSALTIGCKPNGLWFAAGELRPDVGLPTDIAVALPQPDAHITLMPDTLFVRTGITDAHIAWYKDGELLKEGSQDWIEYSESGTYEVFVSDPNGCSNNEAMVIDHLESLDTENSAEMQANLWSALPNPVNDQLTLFNSTHQSGALSLALFTPEGRQLWRRQVEWTQGESTTIDLSDCPKGVYYLRIYDKRQVAAVKVFKN